MLSSFITVNSFDMKLMTYFI